MADNGIGFPENINLHGAGTLGLQLVATLAGEIEGHVELDRSHGTSFKITFASSQRKGD